MTFVINAIQQSSDQQRSVEFLVAVDSDSLARKFLEKSGLVLLSVKPLVGDDTHYRTSYLTVSYENGVVKCSSSKYLLLKDFCLLFLSLGYEVLSVNSLEAPLSPEQSLALIAQAKQLLQAEKQEKAALQAKSDLQEKKVFYDSQILNKAKDVITRLVDKMNVLLQQQEGYISARDIKLIKDRLEEVKKQRMGLNYDKIKDLLDELFVIFARFETEYFASQEATAQPLFDGTVVTTVDLERELAILERITHQQIFGGKIAPQEQDYVAFGKGLFFLSFLKKDFMVAMSSFPQFLFHFFDFSQDLLLFILVFVAASLAFSSTNIQAISYSLISLGLLGFLIYIFSFLKKPRMLFMFLLTVLVLGCYVFLLPRIYAIFSL